MPSNLHVILLTLFVVTRSLAAVAGEDAEFPQELVSFKPLSSSPVFTGNSAGWDRKIRERGWILKDGDSWRMWYTGYNPEETPPMMRLGYATSNDGLTWLRSGSDPLIKDLWVEDMMVVPHESRLYMFAEGLNDQAQLLVSTDGIHWERKGTLDVRLKDGTPIPAGPFGTPVAFLKDGLWHLFYERRDAGIWLATSSDLNTFTNVSDSPIIVPGPEKYDELMIAMNQVLSYNNRYYAVLHGTGTPQKPREWCTFLATSTDLIHWTKYHGNPLLPIPENKSSGQFVAVEHGFRLYTMHDKVDVHFSTQKLRAAE